MEGNFSRNFPKRVENWFEFAGVSNNRGFEKSGVKLQCKSEANPRETTTGSSYREVRETEDSRNRDSTVLSAGLLSKSPRYLLKNQSEHPWRPVKEQIIGAG